MIVCSDGDGLSLAEEKKTKSAHTIEEYQTIYHQKTCSYLTYSVHDEVASTPLFFHFERNCKDAGSPSMMGNNS
jgi:hypothetical protein